MISQLGTNSRELETLRAGLDAHNLLYNPMVQGLLRTANSTFNQTVYDSATRRLGIILNAYKTNAKHQPDPFYPYGPEQLLSKGSLYLMDQMDEVPFRIDPNKLITGLLILGPQGSGKSRFITQLINEFSKVIPSATITVIDPKNGFSHLPNFRHIHSDQTSLDLKSPPNVNQNNFIYEFMPTLANVCSLIYGLDFLNQATDIALSQLQQYTNQTGEKTTLCLQDIYDALLKIIPKNFREIGYHSAAKTALSLILGKQNLFSCRKGLSLEWLFRENTVINSRSLTSEMQCKVLLLFVLFWLYQRAKNLPETKEIKHVIIVDDATRFAGVANQFDANKRTSPLGHILAVLRAAGICVIFATQLPSQIDPAIISLSRSMAIVGNINGEENLRVIQSYMSLTPEQKNAILRFKNREILTFVSDSPWPYPVHGWVPFVADLPNAPTPNDDYTHQIIPWHPLTQIPQTQSEQVVEPEATENTPKGLSGSRDKLIYDCIVNPFDKANIHAKRMGSIREYDTAKTQATQDGFLLASQCGKPIYLIPTKKTFDKFGFVNPYKRAASIEHSFYVNLAAHILKKNPSLNVKTETPIGAKGATIDLTTTNLSGGLDSLEIILNTSNLTSNAAKLQDSAYQTITWLCRDAATASAVKAYFNKTTSLPPELIKKFKYTHFSKFEKERK